MLKRQKAEEEKAAKAAAKVRFFSSWSPVLFSFFQTLVSLSLSSVYSSYLFVFQTRSETKNISLFQNKHTHTHTHKTQNTKRRRKEKRINRRRRNPRKIPRLI
jgi:hypothetical protein